MARYKTIDLSPRFLAVDLERSNSSPAVLPMLSITCSITTLTFPVLMRVTVTTKRAPLPIRVTVRPTPSGLAA